MNEEQSICPVYLSAGSQPNTPLFILKNSTLSYGEFNQLIFFYQKWIQKQSNQTRFYLIALPLIKTYAFLVALLRENKQVVLISRQFPPSSDCAVIDPNHLPIGQEKKGSVLLNLNAPALYFFSSGSTGQPKTIIHSLSTVFSSAHASIDFYQMCSGDRYQVILPTHHVGGMLIFFRMILCSGSLVLDPDLPFDYCSMVPTQLYRLFNSAVDLTPYRSAKKILLGGASAHSTLLETARDQGLPISYTYGMTESASQITAGDFTLGHPLAHLNLIIDEESQILIRGKSLFLGYENVDPQLKRRNGYFMTGDLGSYCPKAGLKLIGRKDRLIIKGGENIHPETIESLVLQTKKVDQAVCLGIEDPEYGQKLVLLIAPYSTAILDLIYFVIKEQLGSFFQPSSILPFPEFEMGFKPSFTQLQSWAKTQLSLVKKRGSESI